MMNGRQFSLGVCTVLLAMTAGRAEVRTIVDHNDPEHATADFNFEHVPTPSKTNVAAKAGFTIVDGERDGNGGGLDKLNDGELPTETDEPAANFFFDARTEVGRVRLDLGSVIDVKRVNTYSWHPGVRAPQVYKIFGSDGTDGKFNPQPKKETDPQTCGWKLIAAVDTRPKQGPVGGQYGVSIFDPDASLGKHRYLLFEISRTETADAFGQTFYSEIEVVDRDAAATSQPVADSRCRITIDTAGAPELKDWAEAELRPVLEKWYPIIVQSLPSEGYTAPNRFAITFLRDMEGVANTRGTHVRCAVPWFKKNLKGEAIGAVVHELVHIVQQYHGAKNPGWLVEGIADYFRWFKYEPEANRPRVNPQRAKYTDSYRTSAAFLDFVVRTYDADMVKKLNGALRENKYGPELWKQFTGKTVDELWDEFSATLGK